MGTTSRPNAAVGYNDGLSPHIIHPAAAGATMDLVQVSMATVVDRDALMRFEGWRAGAQVSAYTVAITDLRTTLVVMPAGFTYVDEVRLQFSRCNFAPGDWQACGVWWLMDDLVVRHH